MEQQDTQGEITTEASPNTPLPVAGAGEKEKLVGVLAYLTLLGFIVAVVMHSGNKSRFGAFHLRQSLGIMATSALGSFAASILGSIPLLGWMSALGIWAAIFALWTLGFIAAINGEQKEIPVLGEHYQRLLANAFT